jgi:hypothetical protein
MRPLRDKGSEGGVSGRGFVSTLGKTPANEGFAEQALAHQKEEFFRPKRAPFLGKNKGFSRKPLRNTPPSERDKG